MIAAGDTTLGCHPDSDASTKSCPRCGHFPDYRKPTYPRPARPIPHTGQAWRTDRINIGQRGISVWQPRAPHTTSQASKNGSPRQSQSLQTEPNADPSQRAAVTRPAAISVNTGPRPVTYAQAVMCRPASTAEPISGTSTSPRQPPNKHRLMDPLKEGRCFRCLARGHIARDCRDPITCRLCRRSGHRQASCPIQRGPPKQNNGFYACLIGEPRDADTQCAQVSTGIQSMCPDLTNPDIHHLHSGEFFLRNVPKEVWKQIHGQNQQIPGGGVITWRRPRPTEGAALPQKSLIRLQAQGIPLGFRTQRHMEELFRHIGLLRGIVCDGIRAGDPNRICVDVEMIADREIPGNLRLEMGGGISVDIQLALKPPAPLPSCTQSASLSSPTSPTT